ncbi:MAG: acyl-CoA thioesterase [Candidatus Kariarchaeaceae archaeon]|jgi:acyl-CoA thioester hydrolase
MNDILASQQISNPFILEIQSRLADTDNLGHLNNVAYIEFLETARTEWHAHVSGSRKSLDSRGWEWILGSLQIKFMKEVCLSDQITVYMWCSRIGTKSFEFSYALLNQKDELVSTAQTTQVGFDFETNTSRTVSQKTLDDLRSRLGNPWF